MQKLLTGGIDKVKEETDPFTGSFISRTPAALVLFRLLMHISDELNKNRAEAEKYEYIEKLVSSASVRLAAAFKLFKDREKLKAEFETEKKGWKLYYDIIDFIEAEISAESDFAEKIKKEAGEIFEKCML